MFFSILCRTFLLVSIICSNAFGMQTPLGKRKLDSTESNGAKVPKTEEKSDASSEKFRKKLRKQFMTIGKNDGTVPEFLAENPNIQDIQGNTLLHYALLFYNRELIDVLLDNPNINITVRNDEGLSFLRLAVGQQDVKTVEKILHASKKTQKTHQIFNEIMDEVCVLLEKMAYEMNDNEIIALLEKFVCENNVMNNSQALIQSMQNRPGQSCAGYQTRFVTQEKIKKFIDIKKEFLDKPSKLIQIFDENNNYEVRADWRKNFSLEEQSFLQTASSRSMFLSFFEPVQQELMDRNILETHEQVILLSKNFLTFFISISEDIDKEKNEQFLNNPDHENLATILHDMIGYSACGAIADNNIELLRKILQKMRSFYFINKKMTLGNTLLHTAVASRNKEAVEEILKHNPNINTQNALNMTPLHVAVHFGQNDIIELLLAYKPDLSICDEFGQTVLYAAVDKQLPETVGLLLDSHLKTIDINARNTRSRCMPVHRAIMLKNLPIIRKLLEYKPDLNVTDTRGNTILNSLLSEHKKSYEPIDGDYSSYQEVSVLGDIILELLQSDLSINITIANHDGETALDYVLENIYCYQHTHLSSFYEKWVNILCEMLKRDSLFVLDSSLAKNFIIASGNHDLIKMALLHGLDSNYQDAKGKTLLDYASEYEDKALIKLIINHKKD